MSYNQKVDNLKIGDLVVCDNCIGIFIKTIKDKDLVISIQYIHINLFALYTNKEKREYMCKSRINTRHSDYQRVFKITLNNITKEEQNMYKKLKKIIIKRYGNNKREW